MSISLKGFSLVLKILAVLLDQQNRLSLLVAGQFFSKKKSLARNISHQIFSEEYHLILTFCDCYPHDLLKYLQKIVRWTAEKNF